MNEHIMKVVLGLTVSSIAAIVESLQVFEGALQNLGLPMLCVAGFGYAIVKLNSKKDSLAERLVQDAKEYATKLERHVEKGAESRAKLIELSEKSLELSSEQLKAQAKVAISVDSLAHEIKMLKNS